MDTMLKRFLLLISPIILLIGCQSAAPTAVTPTPDRDPNCAWYDCGTLHFATQAEWQAASEGNQIATAASFADLVWLQLFGPPPDLDALREQVEYRAFVSSVHRCINLNLIAPATVDQVGPECALSIPISQ